MKNALPYDYKEGYGQVVPKMASVDFEKLDEFRFRFQREHG